MTNHPTLAPEAVRTALRAPNQKDEIMPERIQRKRTKGSKMPETALYVGRGSKWGNPYVVKIAPKGMVGAYPMTENRYAVIDTRPDAPRGNYKLFKSFHDAARYAVDQYDGHFYWTGLSTEVSELTGHDIACWCSPTATCHGDYLLRKANTKALTS